MKNSKGTIPHQPVYVTRPCLPPLEEFLPYLEEIWESQILTNGGPLHQRLEAALCDYLEVPHVCLFNNGTIALLVALQALELTGEVITTPYTFLATTNAILWNGLKPVFVDIESQTLNLDPSLIESAITPRTSAILPVHCYGNACQVDAIEDIANRYRLKVVYDAAHAFGVRCHCGSILNHGDLSVLSFHATKVFNTFEGGAIVCQTPEMKERIDRLKNFGYAGETRTIAVGLNGKMSEIHAAMGLAQLKHIEHAIAARQQIDSHYRARLEGIAGIRCLPLTDQLMFNYSYFPILVNDEYRLNRDQLQLALKEINVFSRRYFFPSMPDLLGPDLLFPDGSMPKLPMTQDAVARVLCLPIYPGLETETIALICERIAQPLLAR